MMPNLEKLRELAMAATHHLWKVDKSENIGRYLTIGSIIHCGEAEDAGQYSHFTVTVDHAYESDIDGGDAKSDAEFIAAMNPVAAVGLLDEIDRLKKLLCECAGKFGLALIASGTDKEIAKSVIKKFR